MNFALWTRGRPLALRLFLALAMTMCSGAGVTQAAQSFVFGEPTPVIDGNGDDLINFATGIQYPACAVDVLDPRNDISFVPGKPEVRPCSPLEDTDGNGAVDYWVNGIDIRRFVAVYNGTDLYLLFRAEGFIGDLDGNGNPDNKLCDPAVLNITEAFGIGDQDHYRADIDIDCDGKTDIRVGVQNEAVFVQGTTFTGGSFAYRQGGTGNASGRDLEILVQGISLPPGFSIGANVGSSDDVLGEDVISQRQCGEVRPGIEVLKSVQPSVICVGETADFTLVVKNTGDVDLTNVTVVDNLPAGLTYVQTVSNTCGGAVNQVGNQITYGPFSLAKGASCTIVIRAGRTAECTGDQVNNAHVEGTFQSPCINNGEPITVEDDDSATVLCGNVTCSISAPDKNVCPGETVEICGPDGNYSYKWSTGETTKCITVGKGTYSLEITDLATGCVSNNTCEVTIVEDPRPICSISAPDKNVCPGETVEICGPDGNYSYKWSTGETTKCITVGKGTYSLEITDLATGCVSNNTCEVTIVEDPRPICSISAPDKNVCPGETVEICGPDGNYSYKWSTGETTKCITVGKGTYSLEITDLATGCVSNNTCEVTIVEDPRPICSISAPDKNVCPGETVEICGPDGNYSYKWSTGETTKCITVGKGTYSLEITDLATGCVSNNTCEVTIVEDPRPICSISAPDKNVCPGETVEICGPDGNYSYKWSTGETTKCITVGKGTYSLEITDLATGCVSNNTCEVTIVEDPRPICSISAPDKNVCPGETVEICGPDGNYSYKWSTGETTKCITVGKGTYSLEITDLATGCVSNNTCEVTIVEDPRPICSISAPDKNVCPGETVEICGPDGNYSYKWSTGETTKCITVGKGTYSLEITDLATGCVSNNTCEVTIVEDPRPICSISAPITSVCPGGTVEICGPDGNYSYKWSTGETTKCITVGKGTYSLEITDLATGCVSNNTCEVTIVEDPRPICSISAPDKNVCPGETVEICGPDGNYSYKWSTGETTKCITVGKGTYSLEITDLAGGCVSNNTCEVTIVEDPRPICSISAPDKNVCPGETVEICGPDGNYSYKWSTGETTKCISVGKGTYSLEITDLATGCVSNNTCEVTIVEDPRPICSISAPDQRVCLGETVEICGPDGNYSYKWSTGETTKCISVGKGTYSLEITDLATGCKSNNTCEVTITEDTPRIQVRKSVSPSGPVDQGTLLTYTITVTNPSTDVPVQNIVVTDEMCDEVLFAGNASPAADSEPAQGTSGNVVWKLASLAPGASQVFSFDARVRELPAPDCTSDGRSCTNRVSVVAYCGEAEARDSDSVTTPINPCEEPGICRLTGGGCLNEEGDNRSHKQSTFGGNSSPAHEGGGPTGNEWQHVYRDGRTILFNWHSHDAHVIACSVVPPGPCSPPAINTRADFVGTGKYSLGAGSREEDGNMVAYVIDHKEGACNRHNRDEYSIVVRTGLVIGEGAVVFQTSGEIDCGNLQIHETPARLFSGTTQIPRDLGSLESVALLNRAVPNPFAASMSYAYEISGSDQPVDIGVYNVAGRLVKSLVKTTQPAGRHTASWTGTDENGSRVAAGVYFVRVRLGAETQQHRVIFLGQ